MSEPTILVVDDDKSFTLQVAAHLARKGFETHRAASVVSAKAAFEGVGTLDAALIDLYLPEQDEDDADATLRGEELAFWIHRRSPTTLLVACSGISADAPGVIPDLFSGFFSKDDLRGPGGRQFLLDRLTELLTSRGRPGVFIVHGHDETFLAQVCDEVRALGLTPLVLRDQPNLGRTIIEKFESYARDVALAIILLSPDDRSTDRSRRRARQNVIFEWGFFYAKLQRRRGGVIVLHKGDLELPSDIAGVVYLQIRRDVSEVADDLAREIRSLGIGP